jgi:hypothetical protein
VYDLIRWATAWLRWLILGPLAGRHRAGTTPAHPATAPALPRRQGVRRPNLPTARSPYNLDQALDGGASLLVRPYLLAADQGRAQRRRRLALVLAADFGLDLDLHAVGSRGVAA